eukprot:TRINITY_DN7726_c0_g1::TRINITY_DN7726_c0_g1_i1::g.8252::m.8252 TRINITY_DN7726_c0_g1::TRINITY_DN7726_c0_g1_i1::g.8252  ORF type:complete len:443 (+),score=54.39,sp/Q40977/MDAR_PEA/32.68/2e-66,Pyr_redox_2/PF07992.9/1.4e-28,Pyr_redox/PF00070.22/3.8e+02,Pyr_redox/PF00070.22/56,Pyr_redox/PF00070.22/5.1e-18,DAO/PF01266.19/0.86,DAO/PF01266.19/0.0059,DAO/PF01266.19/11,Pyr_redox_3/PF13738.1/5.7e-07,Pyr_redox_3/PF13738.1/1.7e+03,HI0933_like/PF03486.9/4.6,HI0933_like/PF03486.9/0.0024,UDPG_MGDP_dh_N/PF03721.
MAAGYAAMEFANHHVRAGEVILISKEDVPPYERCAILQEYFVRGKPFSTLYTCRSLGQHMRHDAQWYQENGIRLMLSTEVTSVDFASQLLATNADINIRYEHLIIATGTQPTRLPGTSGIGNVFYMYDQNDAKSIYTNMLKSREVVIVGAGYVGMELACMMSLKGVSVTVVARGEHFMNELFSTDVGEFYEKEFDKMGIKFVTGTTFAKIEADGMSQVKHCVLANGVALKCDMCVFAIGGMPAVDIKGFAGNLELGGGGIKVDATMRTNVKNVWAVGDVAYFTTPAHHSRRRHPHAQHALLSAIHCVRHLLGKTSAPYELVPKTYCTLGDFHWVLYGVYSGSILVSGNLGPGGNFTAFWVYCNKLVGVLRERPSAEEEEMMKRIIKSRVTYELKRLRGKSVIDVFKELWSDAPPPVPERMDGTPITTSNIPIVHTNSAPAAQ